MLSKMDDYFLHQVPLTIDQVGTTDPMFQERSYFALHGGNGDVLVICGMGMQPNNRRVEMYVCAAHEDTTQINLHWNRELCSDRENLVAGPYAMAIVEPLREWHLSLEDNPSGMTFDLTWTARHLAWDYRPILVRRQERILMDARHVVQSGRFEGLMTIDGRDLDLIGCLGQRDRTWGVRRHFDFHLWMTFQFDDVSVAALICEDPDGNVVYTDGGFTTEDEIGPRIVGIEHDIVFEEGTRRVATAEVQFTDETGKSYDVDVEPVGTAVSLVGPEPPDAGSMARTIQHMHMVGENPHLNRTERWSYAEVGEALKKNAGVYEQRCRFHLDGRVGHGMLEPFIFNHKPSGASLDVPI